MKTNLLPLALPFALLFASCGKDEVAAPAAAAAAQEAVLFAPKVDGCDAVEEILNTRFELTRLNGYVIQLAHGIERPYLEFKVDRGNLLTGFTGCNELTGKYDITCEDIQFTDLATTRMMCPDAGSLEQDFIEALGVVDGYMFNGNKLVLVLGHTPVITLAIPQRTAVGQQAS